MKPPIPTPEPVPVQTLRRYGLHATADEVAEVYRQRGQMLIALELMLCEAGTECYCKSGYECGRCKSKAILTAAI